MLRRIIATGAVAASLAIMPVHAQTSSRSLGVGQMEYTALAAQGGTLLTGMPVSSGVAAVSAAAPVVPARLDATVPDNAPQNNDYTANMASDAFGAQLFTGAFSRDSSALFNPSHVISVGDRIQLRMWNGYNLDTVLVVDAGGNILLP